MGNDILKAAVLHQESPRYDAKPGKSQLLVQMKGGFVAFDHRVKLEDTISQRLSLFHAVAYQLFTDLTAP